MNYFTNVQKPNGLKEGKQQNNYILIHIPIISKQNVWLLNGVIAIYRSRIFSTENNTLAQLQYIVKTFGNVKPLQKVRM